MGKEFKSCWTGSRRNTRRNASPPRNGNGGTCGISTSRFHSRRQCSTAARSIDGVMHYPIETPEERRRLLELKLQDILLLAEIEDDYIPVLFLDAGAYILAEAFGGERIRENELYITSPFLMTEEEIAAMPEFRPEEEHRYAQMAFETLRLFREETAGRIPINIHTPQGPLETFGCMCDSSCFFLALLDDPAAVMKALNKVVDGYIWYIRRQLEILGEQARFNFAMSYTPAPPEPASASAMM